MSRPRQPSKPRPPRPGPARPIDPNLVVPLVDEIVLPLRRRAFIFDDPDSYAAGVKDSAAVLREALKEMTD